jgi:ribonuclease M5
MDRIRIKEALVVEGKYDKNTLSQLVDAPIFLTEGFGIFKDPEKLALLRAAAEKRGLIVLTDSDGAGLVIRNHLKGAIDPARVKHAYIPDVFGKEKRKAAPGKEGKLGVEGMTPAVLLQALRNAGATIIDGPVGAAIGRQPDAESIEITKTDLYELGLTGRPDSKERRRALQKALGLPENLSTNALLTALNCVTTREELAGMV